MSHALSTHDDAPDTNESARANWPARRRSALAFAGLLLLGTLGIAWAAGQQAFSTLAEYDDEGYVMVSLQSYLQGRPLYSETYTQYGPAYYQLQGWLHRLTGWSVTHNVTRAKTVAVWTLAAILSAWLAWRLTFDRWMALVTLLAAGMHLDKLSLEPGHPQELCLLATLLTLVIITYVPPNRHAVATALLALAGLLSGIVLMTKVNVGGLLVGGVGAALLLPLPTSPFPRLRKLLVTSLLAALFLLPALVTPESWRQGFTVQLPLLVFVGVAAVCWWAEPQQEARTGWAGAVGYAGGVLTACGFISATAIANGTSPAALWHGLIGQHLGFDRYFYHSAPIFWPSALLALALVQLLPTARRQPARWLPAVSCVALVVVVGLTCGFALATGETLQSGLQLRGLSSWLLSFGPLVCWATLWPLDPTTSTITPAHLPSPRPTATGLAPTVTALVACLLPLMAYPTPGTQVELGTLVMLICMVTIVARRWTPRSESSGTGSCGQPTQDGCTVPRPAIPRAVKRPWTQPAPAVILALVLAVILVDRDIRCTWRRWHYQPMSVAGATWLRLPAEQARREEALVEALRRRRLDTFVFAEHGQNRFYFWTGVEPPNGLNATFWPYLLTEDQQQQTIRRLGSLQQTCVVSLEHGEELMPPWPVPLRDYLLEHYEPSEHIGRWTIWNLRSPPNPAVAKTLH